MPLNLDCPYTLMTTDVAINEMYISTTSLMLMARSKCKMPFTGYSREQLHEFMDPRGQ
jgi:hypothetical protein